MAMNSITERKRREQERRKAEQDAKASRSGGAATATPEDGAGAEQPKAGPERPSGPSVEETTGGPERKINPAPTKKTDVSAPDPNDVELERVLRLEEHKNNLDRAEWDRRKRIELLQNRAAQERRTADAQRARRRGRSQDFGSVQPTPSERELHKLLGDDQQGSPLPEWMPRDMSKDGSQRFGASDFLGRDNRGRSSRFGGGYLSAEFRENFISSRMEGLRPGDRDYERQRRIAEGAWNQAVRQYDRQFQQFGQEKLKEQSRADFQNRREALLKQQEALLKQQEARQRQQAEAQEKARQSRAEEQRKADANLSSRVQRWSTGGVAYDRNARPENSALTNRELEQAAAEAVRNSAMHTGVEARIVIGSGANAIAAEGRHTGGSTTRIIRGSDTSEFLRNSSFNLTGQSSITEITPGRARRSRGPQVGDVVGGTELNVARREQDAWLASAGKTDEAMKHAKDLDSGAFELVTGVKREESRRSPGGRYAGNGVIVFGDQNTFDSAVAQNQRKRRMFT